jgi:ligand-binding SRPBCC domain-containing protein
MAEHILKRSLTLDLSREEIFKFFADASNLERITPPELNFHIITPQTVRIKKGTIIDYKLRLRGMPMKWQTLISTWNPPYEFVDEALISPYKQWIHRHTFTLLPNGGTQIEDEVRYRLPIEPFGDLMHFFVRRELDYIFDFRQLKVGEILLQKAAMQA